MAFNTGNPIGSNDPRDLVDNAENLDRAVNGTAPQWIDRLGASRVSWEGLQRMVNDFLAAQGFEPSPLVYTPGSVLVVQRPTQLISYNGGLYKIQLPANFPVTLTGTWATDQSRLVEVGDTALRQVLASSSGSAMIGTYEAQNLEQSLKKRPSSSGVSFVDRLVGSTQVRDMYVIAQPATNGLQRRWAVGYVYAGADDPCAEYELDADQMGWVRLWGGFTGFGKSVAEASAGIEPVLTGTFVQAAGSTNTYTTSVGASFSAFVSGIATLAFSSLTDNRGGVWRFRVNGGAAVDISTFSAVSQVRVQKVAEGLDPWRTYKIDAEFIGADPVNPPSGGTARGWITYRPTTGTYPNGNRALTDYYKTVCLDFAHSRAPREIISDNGVNEFAFRVRPIGGAGVGTWIPAHSSDVITDLVETKVYVDGIEIAAGSQPVRKSCKTVIFEQRFAFKEPGGSNIGILNTQHRFDAQGRCHFSWKIYALTDFEIGSAAYGAQFMSTIGPAASLVLNNGVTIRPSSLPADSETQLGYGDVNSAAFIGIGSASAGVYHGAAIDVDMKSSRNLGSQAPVPVNPMLMTTRTSGEVFKVYWKWPTNDQISANTSIHGISTFGIATGIRSPNNLEYPAIGGLI